MTIAPGEPVLASDIEAIQLNAQIALAEAQAALAVAQAAVAAANAALAIAENSFPASGGVMTGPLILTNVATTPGTLPSGAIWSNGGVLMIV